MSVSGLKGGNYDNSFILPKDAVLLDNYHCNNGYLFKCPICLYVTDNSRHIKYHSMVHSGERPHECEICKRSFARPENLNRHMLTHTGDKPYSCIVCNKSFTQSNSLKRHLNVHL